MYNMQYNDTIVLHTYAMFHLFAKNLIFLFILLAFFLAH